MKLKKISRKWLYQDIKKNSDRLDRYDREIYSMKKKKLDQELNVGEKVLILVERLKKKTTLGRFYKKSIQNISYFSKENVFIITNKSKIVDKTFFWLKTQKTINISTKGFKLRKSNKLTFLF